MTKADAMTRVRTVVSGLEVLSGPARRPGPKHRALDVFIGRWINQGRTTGPDTPSVDIVTSDVYEWAPGGFFVLHAAYGRIGDVDVGGIEVIGYDPERRAYRSEFFDSHGSATTSELIERDGVWTWCRLGTRTTMTFSDDGRTQSARHERTRDGTTWESSMEVTLRRIG